MALFAQVLSQAACTDVIFTEPRYAVCVPTSWYRRLVDSGVFLCSEPKRNCTESGGGLPTMGHATLAILAIDASGASPDDGPLATIAQSFVTEAEARISDPVHVSGRGGDIEYVKVWEPFTRGLNDTPLDQYSYFVITHDILFRSTLLFNAKDSRRADYQRIAREVITSLRPDRSRLRPHDAR